MSKIFQPIRGQCGHLCFPDRWNKGPKGPQIVHMSTTCDHFYLLIGPKNTKLMEDVEILLPVKFRWIPFSGLRGEVENISANQRPGWPSCFSDWPKKPTNLVEDVDNLLPVNFRWIPFSGFRGEVENISANQRPGRPSCFSDRHKNHKTW